MRISRKYGDIKAGMMSVRIRSNSARLFVLTMEGVRFRTGRYADMQMFNLQYHNYWEAL